MQRDSNGRLWPRLKKRNEMKSKPLVKRDDDADQMIKHLEFFVNMDAELRDRILRATIKFYGVYVGDL